MREATFTFWRDHGPRPGWARVVAFALVAALVAMFSAPVWHGHADGEPGHDDDCSICAAVATPTGDGLPDLPLFEPPAIGDLVRWMGSQRFAVLWVGRDRASRGPPGGAG